MKIEFTHLEGCCIIRDTLFGDKRGYFFESFNQKLFLESTGLSVDFVQDNQSLSKRGVLRGLHFQLGEFAQAKLVRVLKGAVLDIAVDLRKESPTFAQHVAVELSEESRTQLFVPRGFAHGFVVLSEEAVFFYKCDNYYHKPSEAGIIYNDPDLGIDWKIDNPANFLSEKDANLPMLKNIVNILSF